MPSASDYTQAQCASGNKPFWQDTVENCNWQLAELQAVGFVVNGGDNPCWTDESELQAAIAAGTLKVFKVGVQGQLEDGSDIEKDTSGFSCMPKSIRTGKDNSFSFSIKYDIEDYDFWNEFSQDSGAAKTLLWVNKSGTLYVAPATPSIAINPGQVSDLEVMGGTATWEALAIPKPYNAVSSVFGC